MQSNLEVATITIKDLIIQGDKTSINVSDVLSKLPKEAKRLYISLPTEYAVQTLEEALESKRFDVILVERPISFATFDIQRLLHKQKAHNTTQVIVNYSLRLHPQVRDIRHKITKALSEGVSITSIIIDSAHKSTSITESMSLLHHSTQDIDLLLYLTNQHVKVIQGLGDKMVTSIAGTLTSDVAFTIQLRNQNSGAGSRWIHVTLSNGDVLSENIKSGEIEEPHEHHSNWGSENIGDKHATLEDAAQIIRVYECAEQSIINKQNLSLKYLEQGVTPIRTIGEATFFEVGLFIPCSLNKSVAINRLYSAIPDKFKAIFSREIRRGEPMEYTHTYDELFNYPKSNDYKTVFYTPSIPGTRKDQEMVDALKAGFLVLAEKPAFVNADYAKDFIKRVDDEQKTRLFFGFHYQHHFVFKKVWNDIKKGTFGKIKHIRTFFVVPQVLKNNRIFEPSQGGAGIDVFSYNLHFTLRLIGFHQSFEVKESKIQSAQELDPTNPNLALIDYILESKIAFGNGVVADLYASFDAKTRRHSEGEITFEDGTRMLFKENIRPQNLTSSPFNPVLIMKPGVPGWTEYITEEEMKNPEYHKSTFDQQIAFIRKLAIGEEKYDMTEDLGGLGIATQIKLHEIIDTVFEKGGFNKKVIVE